MRVWYSSASECGSMLCGSNALASRSVFALAGNATASAPAKVKAHTALRHSILMPSRSSDDFEITLQLPIGYRVLPLAPLPFSRGCKVVDEVVAEPVACDCGALEDFRGGGQRTWGARNLFGTEIGARDRRRVEPHAFFH